ncbi:MAG: eukaryotic-like serine/threonine-protein kinase [Candidatus Sumerlaeota bacterium]|nr:eukaryotic-like serine/threonine-protein kinase [Candidatus Sumerlaeota bacterium]
MGFVGSIILGAIAIAALVLAVVVYVRDSRKRREVAEALESFTEPGIPDTTSAPPHSATLDADDETLPIAAPSIAGKQPDAPEVPSRDEALEAERNGDYLKAASLHHVRCDFVAERRALRNTLEYRRLAELEFALGNPHRAALALRNALEQDLTAEDVRLELVQCLLDEGNIAEARKMIDSLRDPNASTQFKASPQFLGNAARSFQAVGEFQMATELCNAAFSASNSVGDVSTRCIYLNKMAVLGRTAPSRATDEISQRFMPAVFDADDDTRTPFLGGTSTAAAAGNESINALLSPYEVIVGHVALGGYHNETPVSVRSIASTASRLELARLIGERPTSVVFEGVDKLLDCPVAIRLSRISTEGNDMALVRDRIRAIAALNHPNLSKITFADRFGPVVRIVSEYHGGGTLVGLLDRLGQLGLPLALRLLLQISAGLHAAHKHGILHGDLRIENIMVGHDNLIKMIDFALRPWPVHRVRADDSTHPGHPGRGIPPAEIQSDIIQFADIIETIAKKVTIANLPKTLPGWDPMDEFREVIERARNGGFSSVSPIHRILLEILDKCLPSPR